MAIEIDKIVTPIVTIHRKPCIYQMHRLVYILGWRNNLLVLFEDEVGKALLIV